MEHYPDGVLGHVFQLLSAIAVKRIALPYADRPNRHADRPNRHADRPNHHANRPNRTRTSLTAMQTDDPAPFSA